MSVREVLSDGAALWWLESRPAEGGRQVVVRWTPEDGPADALVGGFSARTRVHEYGGGAFSLDGDGGFWFSNFGDQRLWWVRGPGAEPVPVTEEPSEQASVRFADGRVLPDGRLVCVRERHLGADVVNDLVAVALDGSVEVVAAGADFFAAPRPGPGGSLAWLQWDLPNMPWDGSELRLDGAVVAGGPEEAVIQPRWSPDGRLHWVSDRTGWWNVYSSDDPTTPLVPMEAEAGLPLWTLGQATYAFLPDGRLALTWLEDGRSRLGVLEEGGRVRVVDLPLTALNQVRAHGPSTVAAVAGSPTSPPAVVLIDVDDESVEVVRSTSQVVLEPGSVSVPRAIEFPTTGGATARALFYAPASASVDGPAGERPPLVVMSHGGPTGSFAPAVLDLEIQFWTTRGIAVVEVDYRGSSGWGRAYRRALDGQWGIVDVDDCVAAARWLADADEVDGARLAITGGSAGGYTVLCALVFRDAFAVGASHYGVGDLEALARDTHKFESRYLDRLVAPYPEGADVYRDRSPVHHAARLQAPVILFQGLEDRVVPPDQADAFAAALRDNGVPFEHLTFEGEGHGFRRAETIVQVAEAELAFFGRFLGFTPATGSSPGPEEPN